MPNNFEVKTYVLGFENSDYLSFDFQYAIIESAKYFSCSKRHYWKYRTLQEAEEAIILIKNKASKIPDFYFYSVDEMFALDEEVDGKKIEDFHIEPPNEEEGVLGCKWLKLPQTLDDFKIFSREVEVTYTECLT